MPILADDTGRDNPSAVVELFAPAQDMRSGLSIRTAKWMRHRELRARQYAVLLARQHAVDLEAIGRSVSPRDVETIAGIAIDTYSRRTGLGGMR